MRVLVTGGAGYIGSHCCVTLLETGFEIVVVDNLCNSKREALRRVEKITDQKIPFFAVDIRDRRSLDCIFDDYRFDAVIHFAGLKAVGESVLKPLEYYHNNVGGSIALFQSMAAHGVKKVVFSSSATVYGNPASVPITEDFPTQTVNPYGRTKLAIEEILRDVQQSDTEWEVILLRYFNPVGAHPSGRIGEDPNGIPNNLFPYISQVAVERRKELSVFGDDYPTRDGTGVRDYIHVMDLAEGHVRALENLSRQRGLSIYNLGTGRGYSVLEVRETFAAASGREIPYRIVARRAGDVAECYADASLAQAELGWSAALDLDRMCRDSWRWQSQNPNGYTESME